MAAIDSSIRVPLPAKGTPSAPNSSSNQPMPAPRIIRPPDRWSRVANSLASTRGLRCGTTRMPVPSRRVEVGGRHVGQPDQRIGEDRRLAAGGSRPDGVVGIRRPVPAGDHHVVDRPDRLEPGRFCGPGQADGLDRIDERADVGEGDTELHCSNTSAPSSTPPDSPRPTARSGRAQHRAGPRRGLPLLAWLDGRAVGSMSVGSIPPRAVVDRDAVHGIGELRVLGPRCLRPRRRRHGHRRAATSPAHEEAVRRAAANCPTSAIRIEGTVRS